MLLCSKSDKALREQLFEATAKDGLLGPKLPAPQAAASWVRLWLGSSEVERETLLMLLTARTRLQVREGRLLTAGALLGGVLACCCPACASCRSLCTVPRLVHAPGKQCDSAAITCLTLLPAWHCGCVRASLQIDTLQFLALRRKLSGRQVSNAEEGSRLGLDEACRKLAAQLPQPDRAMETLGQLLQVRDNHAFAVMQAALAPGASQEVRCSRRQGRVVGQGLYSDAVLDAGPAHRGARGAVLCLHRLGVHRMHTLSMPRILCRC